MTTPKARAQEALEELPEPCPVCGRKPIIGYGKKQGCQMHGEPMQAVTVSCRPDCFGRPFVSAGDVYNGGKHKARQLAIGEWNEKCRQAAAWRTPSPAINQEPPTEKVLDAMCRAYISDWDDKLSFGEGGYQSGYTVDQMNWKKERMKKVYVAIQTTEALEKHAAAVKHSQEK